MATEPRSDFWSAAPGSARWYVGNSDGTTEVWSGDAVGVLGAIKSAINKPAFWGGTDANAYKWTKNDSGLLYMGLLREGVAEEDIGFSPTQDSWSTPMLAKALWFTFHRTTAASPSSVIVPDTASLPAMGFVPPAPAGYDWARAWTMPTGRRVTDTFEQLFGDQPRAVVPVIPVQPPLPILPAAPAPPAPSTPSVGKLLMYVALGAVAGGVVAYALGSE